MCLLKILAADVASIKESLLQGPLPTNGKPSASPSSDFNWQEGKPYKLHRVETEARSLTDSKDDANEVTQDASMKTQLAQRQEKINAFLAHQQRLKEEVKQLSEALAAEKRMSGVLIRCRQQRGELGVRMRPTISPLRQAEVVYAVRIRPRCDSPTTTPHDPLPNPDANAQRETRP